jgi:hypothetical protein
MAVTVKLPRPPPAEDFIRADLEFRGVDHSGPSYEVRAFFNNPGADAGTACEVAEGYAGSLHVFGHGGCFGELGHCDVREEPLGVYDLRMPHQLTPQFKTLIVTEALRRLLQTGGAKSFSVTVVAVVPDNPTSRAKVADPLKFESVSLITYENPSAAGIPLPQATAVR